MDGRVDEFHQRSHNCRMSKFGAILSEVYHILITHPKNDEFHERSHNCRMSKSGAILSEAYHVLITHPKNDENSLMAPMVIRDGSIGTPHNSRQIDNGCHPLQAWDLHCPGARPVRSGQGRP